MDWRLPTMQIPLRSISIENIIKAKKRIQRINIEELQIKIAKKLGYNLVDHKLELYGSKKKK